MKIPSRGGWYVSAGVAAVIAVGSAFLCGCEEGGETVRLTVEPAYVVMSGSFQTFTVTSSTNSASGLRPLSFPLEWTVSNRALGSIRPSGNVSAVYTRTAANGVNVVTVKDQYDAEGYATIRQ